MRTLNVNQVYIDIQELNEVEGTALATNLLRDFDNNYFSRSMYKIFAKYAEFNS